VADNLTSMARAPQTRRKGARNTSSKPAPPARRWSAHVTRTSNALDLERNVFKGRTARAIAASLKRSAERSRRRKGTSYQSAMSMLNFYINRAGRNLPTAQRHKLEGAKRELRRLYGRA
jgi:Protein of unknown function (DUF3175)